MHDVGVQRGPSGQRRQQPVDGLRQVGEQAAFDRLGQLDQAGVGAQVDDLGRGRRRAPSSPRLAASTRAHRELGSPLRAATSPGRCRVPAISLSAGRIQSQSEQPEPVEQHGPGPVGRPCAGRGRCRRGRGVPLEPQGPAAAGSGRPPAAPSGHPASTAAERLTHHQLGGDEADRIRSSPSQSTARVASVTSVSPASGRPRRLARVSASRTASITWALDTGRSLRRAALRPPGQPAGDRLVGGGPQVVYQPGEVDAGAVPGGGGEPGMGPRHPGGRHLAPRQPPQQLRRRRSPGAAAGSAPARARHRRPPPPAVGPLSVRPDRLPHVRLALGLVLASAGSTSGSSRGARPSPRSASGNGDVPSRRDSITSSHQRSGSSYPAAAASARQRILGRHGPTLGWSAPLAPVEGSLIGVAPRPACGRGQVAERDRARRAAPPRSSPATPGRRPRTARTPPARLVGA